MIQEHVRVLFLQNGLKFENKTRPLTDVVSVLQRETVGEARYPQVPLCSQTIQLVLHNVLSLCQSQKRPHVVCHTHERTQRWIAIQLVKSKLTHTVLSIVFFLCSKICSWTPLTSLQSTWISEVISVVVGEGLHVPGAVRLAETQLLGGSQ